MKKYALIGTGLSHSYSTILHEMIYKKIGIEAKYDLVDVELADLEKTINLLKDGTYFGYNVTMPFKIEVMKYLDFISDEAKAIGSVNTIAVKDGLLYGYNTDYYGIIDTFKLANCSVKGKTVYILGTGGASLAAREAVLNMGGDYVFVSRNKENKQNTIDYSDLAKIDNIYAIINATPVGMYPNVTSSPIPDSIKAYFVMDMIYRPDVTKLIQNRVNSKNGLIMFVGQGIVTESIWQNKTLDIKVTDLLEELKDVIK